ncbi:MAG: hypothetical protein K2X02_06660 [Alphaproteobacteria bacterium]|nr:hypothetical protein [Alphaproteobacteria bacterium]
MRDKFLKMTFMALCLSTSSALYAMNPADELEDCSFAASYPVNPEDEIASSSSATSPYVGEYEIRRNDPNEQPSGSVTLRQVGDFLVLENFSLIAGSYYHDHVVEVASEQEEKNPNFTSPFNTDARRIADFVLSALPTEVLQLKCVRSDEKDVQYLGETRFGKLHEIWANIEDKTPRIWVRFQREKGSYFGEMFTLTVETPYTVCEASPIEQFRLFKVGSAEHERLLTPWFVAATSASDTKPVIGSSSSNSAPVVTALELDTPEFHMGKSSLVTTFFSFSGFSAFEGSHRWTEGTKATITIPLGDMVSPPPSHISFLDTRGLITDRHPQQNLTVKVNGEEVGRYVYTFCNNNQAIHIPLPKDDQAIIEFEIPNAISPFDLEINPDKRKLGISFREVQFHY